MVRPQTPFSWPRPLSDGGHTRQRPTRFARPVTSGLSPTAGADAWLTVPQVAVLHDCRRCRRRPHRAPNRTACSETCEQLSACWTVWSNSPNRKSMRSARISVVLVGWLEYCKGLLGTMTSIGGFTCCVIEIVRCLLRGLTQDMKYCILLGGLFSSMYDQVRLSLPFPCMTALKSSCAPLGSARSLPPVPPSQPEFMCY